MKHLKKYEAYNITSTTRNKVIYYFETGQGSKYLITDKGETKRWKAVHSNTGGDDKGLKDWYQKSFFVEPKFEYEANSIQFLIGKGFKIAINIKKDEATIYVIKDNKWVIGNMRDAYPKSNIDRDLKFKIVNNPTIGYNAVEYNLNNDNFSIKNYHFGSEVTNIIDADKITDEQINYFKK
jgi:hypothetical protein